MSRCEGMTKFRCVSEFPNLTVGEIYAEIHLVGNNMNVCLRDDTGEVQYVPKKKFLRRIK